jgi:hypothetical protein
MAIKNGNPTKTLVTVIMGLENLRHIGQITDLAKPT